jgi:hypothetical protein
VAITLTDDSATIGTSEHYLASDSTSATYQTTTCMLQAFVDLANMAAGDSYRVRIYRKIATSAARTVYDATFTGAQPGPCVTPAIAVGGTSGAWEVGVVKVSGTDRSIGWSLATVA